jgi:DNA replication protein DnaC
MSEGRQEYLDNLNRFPLLVIDDLAAEGKTEYMGELIYSVIDSRERAKLPIIITTNLTKEELEKPADMTYKRIFSRLFGNCIPVKVEGKDRRKQRLIADYGSLRDELGL